MYVCPNFVNLELLLHLLREAFHHSGIIGLLKGQKIVGPDFFYILGPVCNIGPKMAHNLKIELLLQFFQIGFSFFSMYSP